MTPEQFKHAIDVCGREPRAAGFVVRALIHCVDALQQTPFADGARLALDHLKRIQDAEAAPHVFGPPRADTVGSRNSGDAL